MSEKNSDERQLLRDPDIEPTDEVIAQALASVNTFYVAWIDGLKERDIRVDWRYYNDGKAWLGKGLFEWTTVRGAKKEVTAFWLSIWEGFFKVTFFIPEKARADLLDLSLDNEIKSAIEQAKPLGKLKFFPLIFSLRSDELFNTVYTIADFRKMIK